MLLGRGALRRAQHWCASELRAATRGHAKTAPNRQRVAPRHGRCSKASETRLRLAWRGQVRRSEGGGSVKALDPPRQISSFGPGQSRNRECKTTFICNLSRSFRQSKPRFVSRQGCSAIDTQTLINTQGFCLGSLTLRKLLPARDVRRALANTSHIGHRCKYFLSRLSFRPASLTMDYLDVPAFDGEGVFRRAEDVERTMKEHKVRDPRSSRAHLSHVSSAEANQALCLTCGGCL